MKKAIAALGISAVTLAMSSADSSALETATVTADALNMRSGPGISYSKRGVELQQILLLWLYLAWNKL